MLKSNINKEKLGSLSKRLLDAPVYSTNGIVQHLATNQLILNIKTNGPACIFGFTEDGRKTNWSRALANEYSELTESLPSNHWKNLNKKPDILNTEVEYVDMVFFYTSAVIEEWWYNEIRTIAQHTNNKFNEFQMFGTDESNDAELLKNYLSANWDLAEAKPKVTKESLTSYDDEVIHAIISYFWYAFSMELSAPSGVRFVKAEVTTSDLMASYDRLHNAMQSEDKLAPNDEFKLIREADSKIEKFLSDVEDYFNGPRTPKSLVDAMESVTLFNWDTKSLLTRYLIKMVLNEFRQDNGYKTGEYSKIWTDEEGNKFEDNHAILRRDLSNIEILKQSTQVNALYNLFNKMYNVSQQGDKNA